MQSNQERMEDLARVAPLYEHVKTVIPEVEWPVYAPHIAAINDLKKQRNAVIVTETAKKSVPLVSTVRVQLEHRDVFAPGVEVERILVHRTLPGASGATGCEDVAALIDRERATLVQITGAKIGVPMIRTTGSELENHHIPAFGI